MSQPPLGATPSASSDAAFDAMLYDMPLCGGLLMNDSLRERPSPLAPSRFVRARTDACAGAKAHSRATAGSTARGGVGSSSSTTGERKRQRRPDIIAYRVPERERIQQEAAMTRVTASSEPPPPKRPRVRVATARSKPVAHRSDATAAAFSAARSAAAAAAAAIAARAAEVIIKKADARAPHMAEASATPQQDDVGEARPAMGVAETNDDEAKTTGEVSGMSTPTYAIELPKPAMSTTPPHRFSPLPSLMDASVAALPPPVMRWSGKGSLFDETRAGGLPKRLAPLAATGGGSEGGASGVTEMADLLEDAEATHRPADALCESRGLPMVESESEETIGESDLVGKQGSSSLLFETLDAPRPSALRSRKKVTVTAVRVPPRRSHASDPSYARSRGGTGGESRWAASIH
jgi:hypothetical protein